MEINEALLEGESANNWAPGVWSNTPTIGEDEWQPDIEPPHINDYAAFKKHKHYGKYFRPYRYTPFPAWVYHKTLEPKIVKSKEEVLELGPEWSPVPPVKTRIDMTGKSLPVKSETQRLAEVISQSLPARQGNAPIDATTIASIVAAVIAALPQSGAAAPAETITAPVEAEETDATIEHKALLELAEKNGIKIDKRWGSDRIKKELGI